MNKVLFGALVGAGLLAGSYHLGTRHEAQENTRRISEAIVEAKENRGSINGTVKDISAYDLCIKLGGLREQCSELRGVGKDKP